MSGSDEYTVTVALSDKGEITDTFCDCPYDFGEFCKHQAAVFYALRDNEKSGKNITAKTEKPKKPAVSLENLLKKQDKTALISLLLEYAEEHIKIRDDLLFRFAEGTDLESKAKAFIKSSIRSAKRRGFVEYGDVFDATDGARKVLQIAGTFENSDGASLCVLVLREMMDLLDNCDDSDGYVGGVISDAIETIGDITESLHEDSPEAGKVFDLIVGHASDRIYNGWDDWRLELLNACVPLCDSKRLRGKLENQLNAIQKNAGEDYYDRYLVKEIQKLTYELIARYDGGDAADRFIHEHLDNSDFRRLAIKKALDLKQLDRAAQLCFEGEKSDAEYAGLVSEWKETRYLIYEKQQDKVKLRELAEELVKDGDFKYFPELKKLYAHEDWNAVRTRVLEALKKSRYSYSTYVEVLIYEDMKPELLDYCRKNPRSISQLAQHLLPDFRDEADAMYVEFIRTEAARATDRSHYKGICRTIKAYREVFGTDRANAIRQELMLKYPRRPAFIDELGKLRM